MPEIVYPWRYLTNPCIDRRPGSGARSMPIRGMREGPRTRVHPHPSTPRRHRRRRDGDARRRGHAACSSHCPSQDFPTPRSAPDARDGFSGATACPTIGAGPTNFRSPMKLIVRWLLLAAALLLVAHLSPGVTVKSVGAALVAALVLGLLNMLVRPLLVLLTLPVTVLTLGLFLFVINADRKSVV